MRAIVLLSLTLIVAGCAKAASSSAASPAAPAAPAASASSAGADGGPSAATVVVATGGGASACDRHLIGPADVQPLLSGPITSVKPLTSDAESCIFATAGFSSVTVTLRAGQGRQIMASWRKGPATPLPGVGDDAVWEAGLKELVAARGDNLCDVTAMGPQTEPATAQTIGALCNKIFAGL